MANPVWGLLLKSLVSNETIEQAIARLITAHNDDEEAHTGVGQSLQSHKGSEIIDHIAESVLNDKLETISRAYTAIVASSGGDFTDIQEAIDFCYNLGGGNVFLRPGTYVLPADLYLHSNVSIEGAGVGLSIIDCDGYVVTTAQALGEEDPLWEDGIDNLWVRDIWIKNGADEMVQAYGSIDFINCKFSDVTGTLVADYGGANTFSECRFSHTLTWFNTYKANDYYGLKGSEGVASKVTNCTFQYCPIAMSLGEDFSVLGNTVQHCRRGIETTAPGPTINGNNLTDCLEYGIYVGHNLAVIVGNFVMGDERAGYYASADGILIHYNTNIGTDSIITGNRIYHFQYGIKLETNSTKNTAVGNDCRSNEDGGILDSGTANNVASNVLS